MTKTEICCATLYVGSVGSIPMSAHERVFLYYTILCKRMGKWCPLPVNMIYALSNCEENEILKYELLKFQGLPICDGSVSVSTQNSNVL